MRVRSAVHTAHSLAAPCAPPQGDTPSPSIITPPIHFSALCLHSVQPPIYAAYRAATVTCLRAKCTYAASAVRSYNRQIEALLRLCHQHDISIDAPFSDTDVCYLLQAYAEGHRVTTVQQLGK